MSIDNNTTTNSATPIEVMGVAGVGFLFNIAQISTSHFETCAVSGAGNVYCWGSNAYGVLGNNSNNDSYTPVEVEGVGGVGFLAGIVSVSQGGAFTSGSGATCAVSGAGNAYCWENNYSGALGNNTTVESDTPVEVLGVGGVGFLSGVSSISQGETTTCAATTGGNAYCWGANPSGQFGNDSQLAP